MKSFAYLVSLLSCTLALSSCKKEEAQPQVELIKDGSVEQSPTVDWFFDYYYGLRSNPNNYKSTRSAEAAASGANSLKISCDSIKNDTTLCYFYQKIDPTSIPTGASLTLKAKAKMVNLKGKGLSLLLIGYQTRTGKVITAFAPSVLIPATGTSDFKEYSVRLDAYPGSIDVLHAYLFYEAKTTGTAYFDDISLVIN